MLSLMRNLKNSAPILLLAALAPQPLPALAETLPADAKPTCVVAAPLFHSWFQSGSVTLNGVVKPANSVTFPNTPNCSFYQWSEQMFLWLTSPAPSIYGAGAHIFDSSAFFDVTPPDSTGKRGFVPHSPGLLRNFSVRAAQVGPNGLPVILSKAGKLLEVVTPPTAPSGNALIRDKAGNFVEIGKLSLTAEKKAVFEDLAGNRIDHVVTPPANHAAVSNIVRKFVVGGRTVFIDPFGNVVESEEGQADDGVLLAQNGSLVYYVTIVNDVYAYMRTGAVDGGITPAPTQFPTGAADLAKIVAFAGAHGVTFPDPDALAIEIKSSWVETTGLPNPGSYFTMTAVVPTYDTSNPVKWTPNGQKTTTLALVGMHVVGSTNGHPEMVWATFEHVDNSPAGTYTYENTANATKTVTQSTAGSWLFTKTNSTGPFNAEHQQFVAPDIEAIAPFNISPTDVLRAKAFGAAANVSPNPIDGSATASNTEIISINSSVRGQLASGDPRANYVFTGATWTIGGAAPNSGNQVGTSLLANSTMETFQQGTDNTTGSGSSNCFDCHTSNTTGVSHVYGALKPLF